MGLPAFLKKDVKSLEEAKNIIEQMIEVYRKQQEAIEKLQAEVAKLKGQAKKPHYHKQEGKASISVTKLLRTVKGIWKKKAKDVPIDHQENVAPQEVCACGSLEFTTIRTTTKIVQGISIQRNNIAYHGKTKQCLSCGKVYQPAFPKDTKGLSFDSYLQTLVSFLKFDCRFTIPLLHRFLTGFGIQISVGEIAKILKRNSHKLIPSMDHLKTTGVKKSRYLQTDATGIKRMLKKGKVISQHLNILGHEFLSIFKITRSYDAEEINKLLGVQGRKKPLVSDDGSPNNACKCKGQQLCLVHEIRLYKKLFPFFNGNQALQKKLLLQWRKFYHLAKQYGSDPPRTATPAKKKVLEEMFDAITHQVTGYADLDKQLKLSWKKREKLLFFLDHPFMPIHNNLCEQGVREAVIIRKISGPTKSFEGDRSIERHLSVIQTAKKQGLPIFQTLHGLLTGQLSPDILTVKTV